MKEFSSSNFKSTEAISKAKSQQQKRTKMNSEVLCNNSSMSGFIIHNSFSKLEIWYPHSPGCSYLGCDWDDHQEDTIAHLPFEQDLAFRTCLPHPCLWNVCPTCLPHVRSYPRTQPRDSNVVLKSSGLETWMKPLQTSINTLRSGRNWLILWPPKKSPFSNFFATYQSEVICLFLQPLLTHPWVWGTVSNYTGQTPKGAVIQQMWTAGLRQFALNLPLLSHSPSVISENQPATFEYPTYPEIDIIQRRTQRNF